MKKIIYALIIFLVLITPVLIAQEDIGDIKVKGIELEKVLSFINGIIAFALFLITFIAYKRDGRKRLWFVSMAFFIFSLKSFLVSSELFITGLEFIDPISIVLDLIALLLFFYGILKKDG
ncbi:hypothetical protein J4221_06790 [Candidatus Pacearchaeota archaeon]|nr:hypothetical protein [Candidatus Pacearchaeota archaeon]